MVFKSINIKISYSEEEMENYFSMGREFQFHKMKRIMEIDGGDGYTTL